MNSPACIVCGGTSAKRLTHFMTYAKLAFPGEVQQCRGCGLARLVPMPSQEELCRYYAGESYLAGHFAAGLPMVTEDLATQRDLQERLERLEHHLGRPGRLLDVGASSGHFLAMARDRGWSIEGVELGDEGVRLARERHGIELYHGAIETAPFSPESFDVVHASHVLEHLPDPVRFLNAVRRLLKPGGRVVIEVPGELSDLFTWIREHILRRSPDAYLVASPHLYFYTPPSLSHLLQKNGFHIERLTTPRRNKSAESRIPLGRIVKSLLYRAEFAMRWGPLIEIVGTKSVDQAG